MNRFWVLDRGFSRNRLRPHPAFIRLQSEPHLPSDFVCVDDLTDDRARDAASLVGLGMERANARFDRTAP